MTTPAPFIGSLVSERIFKILQDITADLEESEQNDDNISIFSGILWLECPQRHYAEEIAALCSVEPNGPFTILMGELNQKVTALTGEILNPTIFGKYIFVICALIRVLPVHKTNVDVNIATNSILKMRISKLNLGPIKTLFIKEIYSAVEISVKAGSNPIPGLMTPDPGESTNPMTIISGLQFATCSASTFRCVLGTAPSLLMHVTTDNQERFISSLGGFFSKFFRLYPEVHTELLTNGLNQAEMIITELLKWHSPPQPNMLPILASLMPFCHGTLSILQSAKKNQPFLVIMKLLEDYKSRKPHVRIPTCLAFLEIATVASKDINIPAFKIFTDFVDKHFDSLNQFLFKKGDNLTNELIDGFLPRWAAIEFVRTKGDNNALAFSYMTSHIETPIIRKAFLDFLNLIFTGFPVPVQTSKKIPSKFFADMATQLCTSIQKIVSNSAQSEDIQNILRSNSSVVAFLGTQPPGFNLYSVMKIHDINLDNVDQIKQFKNFIFSQPQLSQQAQVAKSLISYLTIGTPSTLPLFIILLRTLWTPTDYMAKKFEDKSADDVMAYMKEIMSHFNSEISRGLQMNSMNVTFYPSIFYRFIKFVSFALKSTGKKPTAVPDHLCMDATSTFLYLRSCTTEWEAIQQAENLYFDILRLCGRKKMEYKWPMTKLSVPDKVIQSVIKTVFSTYLQSLAMFFKKKGLDIEIAQTTTVIPAIEISPQRFACSIAMLCKFINHLESTPMPGADGKTCVEYFFHTLSLYLENITEYNNAFAKAFENLDKSCFVQWYTPMKGLLFKMNKKADYSNYGFWMTAMAMCSAVARGCKLTAGHLKKFELLLPYFETILTFGHFVKQRNPIIRNFLRLAEDYCKCSAKKNILRQIGLIETILDAGVSHSDKNSPDFDESYFITISNSLKTIYKDLTFPQSAALPHLADISSNDLARRHLYYLLEAAERFLTNSQAETLLENLHITLLEVIKANPSFTWQMLIQRSFKTCPPLRALILEVVMEMYGTKYTPIPLPDPIVVQSAPVAAPAAPKPPPKVPTATQDDSASMKKKRFSRMEERSESSKGSEGGRKLARRAFTSVDLNPVSAPEKPAPVGRKSAGPTLKSAIDSEKTRERSSSVDSKARPQLDTTMFTNLSLSRFKRKLDDFDFSANTQSNDPIYQKLTENNFEIYLAPPDMSLSFLKAAIALATSYGFHDTLFEAITRGYMQTKPAFSETEPFSMFYIAWFAFMAEKISIPARAFTNKVEGIEKFISSFNLPNEFVYYVHNFSVITGDKKLTGELFWNSFMKRFCLQPMEYNIPKRIHSSDSFLSALKVHPSYTALVDSMMNVEPIPPILYTDIDPYLATLCHYLDSAPACSDEMNIFEDNDWMDIQPPARPSDLITLKKRNCVIDVGYTADGTRVYLISLQGFTQMDLSAYEHYVYSHFNPEDEYPFTFIIDCLNCGAHLATAIPQFVSQMPEWLDEKISKIYVINPSLENEKQFSSMELDFGERLVLCDDLTTALSNEDLVSIPVRDFPFLLQQRGSIPVEFRGSQCRLYLGINDFYLSAKKTLFGSEVTHTLSIPLQSIDTITATPGTNQAQIVTQNGTYAINTPLNQLILFAYQFALPRSSSYKAFKLPHNVPQNFKSCTLALAIVTLASRTSTIDASALQLYESAMAELGIKTACSTFINQGIYITLRKIYTEIIEAGLLEEVCVSIAPFMESFPTGTLQHLLPLLVDFFNACANRCHLAAVARAVYAAIREDIDPLERGLFTKITNRAAIEVLIPTLFQQIQISPDFAARIAQCFMLKNGPDMADLIVQHYLDGFIRRRCFDHSVNENILFSILPTLPFNSKEFIKCDMPLLFFNTIMGSIHAPQSTVRSASLFLNSIIRQQLDIHPDLGQPAHQLLTMLEAKNTDPISILKATSEVMDSIGSSQGQQFRKYLMDTSPDDSPNIWYIKISAQAHLHGAGDEKVFDRLINTLPSLISSTEGPRKLAFALETMTMIIDRCPPTKWSPLFLVWVPLLSCAHSDSVLRKKALLLVEKVLTFAMANGQFKNFNGIETTQYITENLANAVATFSKDAKVSFNIHFSHGLVSALTRAIEEETSRDEAIEVLKTCIVLNKREPMIAIHFVLPLICYSDVDPQWVMQTLGLNCESINALVFYNFSDRMRKDGMWIIAYLCSQFGNTSTNNKREAIMDVLIYGSKNLPEYFISVGAQIVEKAWTLIDDAKSLQSLEKLSVLSAQFMSIGESQETLPDVANIGFTRIPDVKLNHILAMAADGTSDVLKMDL